MLEVLTHSLLSVMGEIVLSAHVSLHVIPPLPNSSWEVFFSVDAKFKFTVNRFNVTAACPCEVELRSISRFVQSCITLVTPKFFHPMYEVFYFIALFHLNSLNSFQVFIVSSFIPGKQNFFCEINHCNGNKVENKVDE